MSDEFTAKVDIEQLLAALGNLEHIDLEEAALAGGLVVEGYMKANIIEVDFIDTGATLNSVMAQAADDDVVEIGPLTEYAIFGELGIGQPELRFARNALDQNKGQILAVIAENLKDQIKKKAK